jgi:genome maintenance exonuclease 1|tara:strand:+ start:289 stop:1026 length:738 start_codon:yes stop_codon:yes gene_type:complete
MTEDIKRVEVNGRRHYQIQDGGHKHTFPSVTTILSHTSDKSGLVNWRKRVGEAEADRISKLSMDRGSVMHRLIELYKLIDGTKDDRLNELKKLSKTDEEVNEYGTEFIIEGWKMFMKFWNNHELFFDRVAEVLESETFLWSSIGYAGTVDNISKMTDESILVIDYKNSRKPKRDEWIQDYYLQLASYYVAYYQRSRTIPNGAEIWIANELDDVPQVFKLTKSDIKHYFEEFRKRLNTYNEQLNKL